MGKFGAIDTGVEVDEDVYVRFTFPTYGYAAGDVVRARADMRDRQSVHVQIWSRDHKEVVAAWGDLASFVELSAMEVLALAAAGLLPEESYGNV